MKYFFNTDKRHSISENDETYLFVQTTDLFSVQYQISLLYNMYQIKVFCSITVPVFIFLRFRFFTTSAAFSMLQIIYRFLLTFWHCKKKDKIRMAMKDTKIAHTDMWYSFLLCALCRLSSIFSGFFIWTFSGGCAQVGAASIPCTFG